MRTADQDTVLEKTAGPNAGVDYGHNDITAALLQIPRLGRVYVLESGIQRIRLERPLTVEQAEHAIRRLVVLVVRSCGCAERMVVLHAGNRGMLLQNGGLVGNHRLRRRAGSAGKIQHVSVAVAEPVHHPAAVLRVQGRKVSLGVTRPQSNENLIRCVLGILRRRIRPPNEITRLQWRFYRPCLNSKQQYR